MVGKKSGRAQMREEGLERTDNNLELSSWPQVSAINQKNYYTEFLKRDDQFLAFRTQNEEARDRMVQQARDKDRALAHGEEPMDVDASMADDTMMEENTGAAAPNALGSRVVVIHPGSQNLRIGFGSDALPKSIPMCIARKAKNNEGEDEDDEPAPKRMKVDGEVPEAPEKWFGEEFAKGFATASTELKTRMKNNKRKLLPNSKELVLNYNKRQMYDEIKERNDPNPTEYTEVPPGRAAPDFYVGEAALRLPQNSNPRYKLFWPLRYGCLNERDYDIKNLLYNDFSAILEEAIRTQLGLNKRALPQYSCVFIIPDLYERNYVTSILSILIRDIGFGRVCFQQESLASTFGAGSSIACVVDIGHQKTSICCVDEGLCLEDSRMNIKIGGDDVTQTFMRMTLASYFPYAEINLTRRHDYLIAEELKQKHTTIREEDVAPNVWEFYMRSAGQDTRKYSFRTYDEPYLAPTGFFRPTLFGDHQQKLEGRRKLIQRSVDLYDGSPNDPVSASQNVAIQVASGKDAKEVEANDKANEAKAAADRTSTLSKQLSHANVSRLVENGDTTPKSSTAGSPPPEGTPVPGGADATPTAPGQSESGTLQFNDPILEKIKAAEEKDKFCPVMALDYAIITSITYGARNEDRKIRDFMGGILFVGGGSKTPGLRDYVEERLKLLRPFYGKEILVGPPPRELDPQVVAWKGGSVFGKLSASGNDSWISQKEYDMLGSRLLVHKCMFNW